ncbi:DUF1501 domain-containing protein [Williamsia sterculiae]|uniref:Uncharacterized conserved protein, DUF1501 family n=1 Tax=Williamsia sterculiae TaxID=1344003 RepID=A0A1N7F2J0_9NOCA|nr:DUF1501 domain-containing protein [Williamsia sterculiae]SIR94432.1 Uncharacterized conserved protein, DUF1501 family [Williamsia sterculiae]
MRTPIIDRRRFLLGSGVLAALGVVGGVTTVTVDELTSAAADRPRAVGDGVVVLVTMYGGNDGINTLIPYADNAYHDNRAELAYDPDKVLHLDDTLALNPAMTGLADQWKKGSLAVVRGVGYPNPDHSHFRSMDIWQTATPASAVHTGWVGRWLDATGDDPLRAVNVGPVLPMLAIGEKSTAAALNTTGHRMPASAVATLSAMGQPAGSDTAAESAVCRSYDAEKAAAATFGPVVTAQPAGSAEKAGDSLSEQLQTVGRCVKAGVPTKVYSVTIGGFDTHADERETQERLLGEFDKAVSAFLTDMASDPRGRDVVLMAYSEFGRRVKANASQGTDHGTAGPVFVAGTPVRGGFYGDEPSLTDLDDGDLKSTVDFRDVYAELLDKGIGNDPTPAVGSDRRPVGFL